MMIYFKMYNRVQLIWVPEHEGIVGNETANQLTKTGSEHPFIGPEPACSISVGFAKKAVRDWTNKIYKKYWESTIGVRKAKGFIQGPSARRTKDLLKLIRGQLRWVVGLLKGHWHLKGHLFKLGLINDPICERCLEEEESTTHILCDCEAVAHITFLHLCQSFMERSDYYDAPIDKVLHFIRGVGLIRG
jgi:hypothetical protein